MISRNVSGALKVTSSVAAIILVVSVLAWGASKRLEATQSSRAAAKKAAYAERVKADPCMQYQESALYHLTRMRETNIGTWQAARASMSAAYSGYYLVCRDLEKRK